MPCRFLKRIRCRILPLVGGLANEASRLLVGAALGSVMEHGKLCVGVGMAW